MWLDCADVLRMESVTSRRFKTELNEGHGRCHIRTKSQGNPGSIIVKLCHIIGH